MHTGFELLSMIETAMTHLDDSGSPHLSTTWGAPRCLSRASTTNNTTQTTKISNKKKRERESDVKT